MNEGPSQLNKVKCPQCKYDLRGQLGVPMPRVVRCPECGGTFRSREIHDPPVRWGVAQLVMLTAILPSLMFIIVTWLFSNATVSTFFDRPNGSGDFWRGLFIIGLIHIAIVATLTALLNVDRSWRKCIVRTLGVILLGGAANGLAVFNLFVVLLFFFKT